MFKVSQLFHRKFKPGASNVTDISGEKMIDLHIPLRDMAQSELKPEVRLRTASFTLGTDKRVAPPIALPALG